MKEGSMNRELKTLNCMVQGGDCKVYVKLDGNDVQVMLEVDGKTVVTIIKKMGQCPEISTDLIGVSATLDERVTDWPFSVRTRNCLYNASVVYIGELIQKRENDLLKVKNFGRIALKDVKEHLAMKGLALGMHLKDWVKPDAR